MTTTFIYLWPLLKRIRVLCEKDGIGEKNMYGSNRNRDFGDRPRQSFAPVKVGDELDVTIEAVGEKGDGICKKKGFVLFVPNTKQGDNVKIRVTKVLRKVGFAEVIGPSSGAPAEEAAPKEEAAPEEEEVPAGEESENFGEEPAEEQPAEEPSEEEQ